MAEFIQKHEDEMAAFKEDCKLFKEKNEAEKENYRLECEQVRSGRAASGTVSGTVAGARSAPVVLSRARPARQRMRTRRRLLIRLASGPLDLSRPIGWAGSL